MEIGIISLSDLQARQGTDRLVPAAQRLREIVGYARLADELRLDVFALGEHHGADFAVSSPAVVLSSIAAQTSAIRLTSGVTVLSTLDPVRVYEDFATVDLLSGGRAEITAGRSAFTEPFELFGVDLATYDEVFAEKLDLLLRLRSDEPVTWHGTSRPPLAGAVVHPRAAQRPLPVWAGVGGTPASAERAGRLGLPMIVGLIGGPLDGPRRIVDVYREAGERAGHADALRVGISTHFHAARTSADARAVHPYYYEYLRPKRPGGRGFVVDRQSFELGTSPRQALMIGSPEEIVDKIGRADEALGLDRFLGQVDWGGLPAAMVEDSIALLATQIAPSIRG